MTAGTSASRALYTKTLHNAVFRNLAVESNGATISAVTPEAGNAANSMPLYAAATDDYWPYIIWATPLRVLLLDIGTCGQGFRMGTVDIRIVHIRALVCRMRRSLVVVLNQLEHGLCHRPEQHPLLSLSVYDVPHKLSVALGYTKRYAVCWRCRQDWFIR